ncbi:TniQ family protein [Photobacterium leiognathi]|uniref:TniQ family protein n=1 Tax=Photobacterium leiognathi TaxID=553611 RepID=UPI003AF3B530
MFLQRPEPHSDESLESFFIRVANNNGYEDIHRFLLATKKYLQNLEHNKFEAFPTDITKINPYSSKNNHGSRVAALHKIALMTFNEYAEILSLAINRTSLTYSPSTTALVRGSEVIPRSLLRSDAVPCCPKCLKVDGYGSYLWHFKGYDYCHKHHVSLKNTCNCGSKYDYRTSGLSGICQTCNTPLPLNTKDTNNPKNIIALWLSGKNETLLPELPQSYRWGLIHWWTKISKQEFDAASFISFWQHWPESFHKQIEAKIEYNLEYSTNHRDDLRVKDLLDDLFFSCIRLPERNLKYNLILNEILSFIDTHLWQDDGLLANLKMNAIEVCIFLNCSQEQVISLVEQRLLNTTRKSKQNQPLRFTDYLFHLGDVYCLWVAAFQTDEFNRTFIISR